MRTVIVTGGSSGLGAAVVRRLGECAVCLDIRDPCGDVDGEIVDLADGAAVEDVVDRVAKRRGGIDGVVTAAGVDACGSLVDVARDAWERVIAVNLLGTVSVVRSALPHLDRSGGRLVTVASTLGLRALPDATAYCASKFGVVGFTRALAAEVSGRVGVTLLIPGGMNTAFFDSREPKYKPGADAQLNDPKNVAEAVAFALSQPAGCELRELVITPPMEPSWP
jgi:NAD(P)-dependent dehydrogenase (short-subunit alcohol dehydrogenase family)